MTTPFFPAFRCRLAALGRRSLGSLRQTTLVQLGQQLRQLIPEHLTASQDEGDHSRERIYTLRLTFECFIWQVLNPGTSCREVVRQVQTLCRLEGRPPVDDNTSAYVKARQHLPADRLEQALGATARAADQRADSGGCLGGRPVKAVDGSTTQAPDTSENQKDYPQPSGQKPGCGFPVMKLAVLFSLASGAVLDVIMGNLHAHDLRLFRQLWDSLKRGDILLGDRAYGEYATLAALPQRGVDVVARLHQRRKVDFRKAKRLSRDEGLFTWQRGYNQSEIFSPHEWALLPLQITVRIVRFAAQVRGFRVRRVTLVTTLLDPQLYPALELSRIYARRWRLELCLRDLKTTLGMEVLRCQTPAMIQKEVLAYLIAHNLMRCVMAEAAALYQVHLERISFKGTLDAVRQYSAAMARARNQKLRRLLWEDLLINLVRDQVPLRPNRTEPRAVKRRPKPYPLLNKPRRKFKETPHRNRYWKNNPRKTS
jgi:Transposase DDE domain